MNYHSNQWIMQQLHRHEQEALKRYKENQIIGIFCQGSQNYNLDTENSDIDTKCILTPSFKDIALAKPLVSTTHILDNNEHLDAKDIRSYMSCFRKQNLNFLEILFTPYEIINPAYAAEWHRLYEAREQIAHMNPWRAVKSMKGIALEKYHAMEHEYPSKVEVIAKYGYDGKQVHHLLRVEDYLNRYISGEAYSKCLIPSPTIKSKLLDYKLNLIPLEEARTEAKRAIDNIENIANEYCALTEDRENIEMRELLEDVSYSIMKIAVQKELWAK